MSITGDSGTTARAPEPAHHSVGQPHSDLLSDRPGRRRAVAITIWLIWTLVTWSTTWSAIHSNRLPAGNLPAIKFRALA